jgi:hypothetical protein
MGNLKPGATYIYERVGGTVYQREMGSNPLSREAVGWDYDPRTEDGRPLIDHMRDSKLWGDIRRAASEDSHLQDLLDRVKVYYTLKYQDGK